MLQFLRVLLFSLKYTNTRSPTDQWLPTPAKHIPPNVVRQGPKEGTVRERREDHLQASSLLCGGRTEEQLSRRVMFGTMVGGKNPGPGRPEKNWAQCLVDDFRVFGATKGSTESVSFMFGVETVLWPTAAKTGGKWYWDSSKRRNVS